VRREASPARKAVATLAAIFPHPEIPEVTLEEYAKRLGDIDPRLLDAAVETLIENGRFFPTLSEIKATLRRLMPDSHPEPESIWGEVVRQIHDVGHAGRPVFADELVGEAIESSVGWSALCSATTDTLVSHRSRLLDCYRTLLERRRFQESLPESARRAVLELAAEQEAKRIGGPT